MIMTKFHFNVFCNPNYTQKIQKRFAYTDKDVVQLLKKNNRTTITHQYSSYDPNASKIIKAIKNRDYKTVKELAKVSNINGHDRCENTPLTDAASRGDNDGIKFLITEVNANIHASCDCPYNKTALHYAAEGGHTDTVKLLLELGANPNMLDSRKYTALDVAKNDGIKRVLELNGGMHGAKLPKILINIPRKGLCNLIK